MSSQEIKKGTVYLVGAGPGDPDLITVRAKHLLDNCDAVVYDSLIPYELILTLPAEVEHHYVGKQAGRHSLPQPEIHQLLVKLASQGKQVVRLKGGDPFVFGRGGEEAEFLKEHGVRYEVVPGVTSGVAALAYAGIPCTHRRDSSYVMFLTAHKAAEKDIPGVPWDWVAGARDGTLVIYMGVAEIKHVIDRVIAAGMDPDTPSAVIERGTCSTQRAVTTKLSNLPDKVVELAVKPPALFVIGEVAKYREKLQWFQDRPLSGVRVMVTRPADQAMTLYRHLRELGAEVLAYPTIATAGEFHDDEWEAMSGITAKERWLVFTSENGVRYFLDHWFDRFGDVRGLKDYRIAAAGDGTVSALQLNHIVPDITTDKAYPGALAQHMTENMQLSNAAVIRVRGNLGGDLLEKTFEKAGAKVISLRVHRTFPAKWPPEAKEKLFAHPPDVVMFTSGSAVEGLVENLDESELKRLTVGATVVSIGQSASQAIRSRGMVVGLESKKHTLLSLADEMITHHRAHPFTK